MDQAHVGVYIVTKNIVGMMASLLQRKMMTEFPTSHILMNKP